MQNNDVFVKEGNVKEIMARNGSEADLLNAFEQEVIKASRGLKKKYEGILVNPKLKYPLFYYRIKSMKDRKLLPKRIRVVKSKNEVWLAKV